MMRIGVAARPVVSLTPSHAPKAGAQRVVAVAAEARCGRRPVVLRRTGRGVGGTKAGPVQSAGRRGQPTTAQASDGGEASSIPRKLLIIECDGVLIDIHKDIHLAAFNEAFRELGLDCANWTPAIYTDLIRMGDGTVKGMLEAYFGMVGWPMFLATSDRPKWCAKVEALKKEAVPKLIAGQKVKLRDGAESFLRGILADGSVKLAVVAATASDPEDTVAECALAALGSELRGGILVFGSAASGARPPPESLEAQLAVYIQQQKTDAASRVQKVWEKSSEGGALPVNMDASLLGMTSQRSTCSAELLSTVAALAGVSKQHAVFMTCSGALVHTACAAGMKAVVVKNSLLCRGAEHPSCAGSFDGFGAGGGATVARLLALMS